ncbi:MAG: hypothetical protein AAFZ65_06265 [Planctomycetota bacterium]
MRNTTLLLALLAASCSSTYGARWQTITVRGVIPEDKARLTFEDESAGAIVDRLESTWKKRKSVADVPQGTDGDDVFLVFSAPTDAAGTVRVARVSAPLVRGFQGLPYRPMLAAVEGEPDFEVTTEFMSNLELRGGDGDDVFLIAGEGCRLESLFVQWGGAPDGLAFDAYNPPNLNGLRLRGGDGDDFLIAPSVGTTSYWLDGGDGDDRLLLFRSFREAAGTGGGGLDEFMFPMGDVGNGLIAADEEHAVTRVSWIEDR